MRATGAAPTAWRTMIVLLSLAGVAALVLWLEYLDLLRPGYLVLSSLPLALGAAAGVGPMGNRTRIMFLWLAALMSGFVAVITIMSGAGVVLLAAMVIYLVAAWGLNEAGEAPS